MPTLAQRLKLLISLGGMETMRPLREALPMAGDHELPPLCRALAASGSADSIAAVVETLHRLPPDEAAACARIARRPGRVLARFPQARRMQYRLNAIRFIALRRDPTLAESLTTYLDDEPGDDQAADSQRVESSRSELRREAAEALLELVRHADRRDEPHAASERPAADRHVLDRAVARALAGALAHREPAVLIAAAMMSARPGPRLALLLADENAPESFLLRSVPDLFDRRDVRVNLLRWLTCPPIGRAALRRLSELRGREVVGDVLSGAHLLLRGGRRRMLRQIRRAPRGICDPAMAAGLPEPAQVGLVELVTALGLSTQRRVDVLEEFIALPSPLARQRVVRALHGPAAAGHAAALSALERFARDRNEDVASLAVTARLECSAPVDREQLERWTESPHARVADAAAPGLMRIDVEAFTARLGTLSELQRRAIAHHWMATDRPTLIDALAAALTGDDHEAAACAIALVRRLALADQMVDPLCRAAASASSRLVSAAVAALGESGSEAVIEIVRRALDHDHPRVRSNAIEAVLRLELAAMDESLALRAGDAANRPRATAVAGLLRRRSALGVVMLRQMLADWNPMHRLSAIWACRFGSAAMVRDELRRVAEQDAHPEVRIRAVKAWARLQVTAAPPEPAAARLTSFAPRLPRAAGGRAPSPSKSTSASSRSKAAAEVAA